MDKTYLQNEIFSVGRMCTAKPCNLIQDREQERQIGLPATRNVMSDYFDEQAQCNIQDKIKKNTYGGSDNKAAARARAIA